MVLELSCELFEFEEGEDARRSANCIMWRCVEAFVLSESQVWMRQESVNTSFWRIFQRSKIHEIHHTIN